MPYEAVIGLEVHAQLLTRTKLFCGCANRFGAEPNTQVCPVCSGMPGVLPVLNRKAVELAVRMGLATGCAIREESVFARKNYFYPDLPKAYQISQYDRPLCEAGHVDIEVEGMPRRRIGLTRIHMEEDAGKSIHDRSAVETCVDFNRCGTPLIEIVTDPDLSSPEEAYAYLTRIRRLLRWLAVCDGNMEEGSLRCDANVSIRPVGEKKLGTKTELKNMNSFRNVERAIRFEIERQRELVEGGGKVVQETLLWDADTETSRPMRGKEDAHDYRYFPEPDLMPVLIETKWVDEIRAAMPELPEARRNRFVMQYKIPEYDAGVLTSSITCSDYYEQAVLAHPNPKALSNWMMTDVLRLLDEEKDTSILRFSPVELAKLVSLIDGNRISGRIAKTVFEVMAEKGGDPEAIVKDKGLAQVSDEGAIAKAIEAVLARNPAQVAEFKAGKTKVIGFFVGEIMKEMKGKANPKVLNELLQKRLAG